MAPDKDTPSPLTDNIEPADVLARPANGRPKRARLSSSKFGSIVVLLMRSEMYRHLSLSDLEWLVLPALALGQYVIIAGGQEGSGREAPIGLAVWAQVSDVVDQKLAAQKKAGLGLFRLAPAEWRSGNIVWLFEMMVPRKAQRALADKLLAGPLKGKSVKRYHDRATRSELPPIQ